MEIAEKFSLAKHGLDTVLFDQMIGTLDFEDQTLLDQALESVAEDRREFIAKILQPYLREYSKAINTGRDSALVKHARIGMNALYHAVSLTHLPYSVSLMEMTAHQSQEFIGRVIQMMFFYPMGVAEAFHDDEDETFVNAVCGAGLYVMVGDTGTYKLSDLVARGREAREAITIENLISA